MGVNLFGQQGGKLTEFFQANRDFLAKIRKALADADAASKADAVDTLDNTERQAIVKALRQSDGNMSAAAQLLGITRQSLYRRMEKLGIK